MVSYSVSYKMTKIRTRKKELSPVKATTRA